MFTVVRTELLGTEEIGSQSGAQVWRLLERPLVCTDLGQGRLGQLSGAQRCIEDGELALHVLDAVIGNFSIELKDL